MFDETSVTKNYLTQCRRPEHNTIYVNRRESRTFSLLENLEVLPAVSLKIPTSRRIDW
jgi:hypothetical protein